MPTKSSANLISTQDGSTRRTLLNGTLIFMAISLDLEEIAADSARSENTDYLIYKRMAESSKKDGLSSVLTHLANTEYRHYEFWKSYCNERKVEPSRLRIYLVLLLKLIFGASFAIKFLEKHESDVVKKYKSIAHLIPREDQDRFNEMIGDEEEHEDKFANQIQGTYVKYISFIILGLADAIVEISGIHAGSLGIYKSTEFTGLAGIVAGAAASLAMASAAYAQAKQGFQGKASISAAFTGISYFVTALILALPYFLTKIMLTAISASLVLGVLIIAFTSYYNSVLSGSKFVRDFGELAGIMLGASVVLYFFGLFIAAAFGITI